MLRTKLRMIPNQQRCVMQHIHFLNNSSFCVHIYCITQLLSDESAGGTFPVDLDTEQEPKPTSPSKRRLYYIDNLKSFLTAIVVLHHITCTFVGSGWMYMLAHYYHSFLVPGNVLLAVDQTYFMCLFFFISGHSPTHSLHSF